MNTSNPFDSQATAQEQINKSRARLRLAIFAAFGISLVVLVPLLVQGCKRQEEAAPVDNNNPPPPIAETTNLPSDLVNTNLSLPPLAPLGTNVSAPVPAEPAAPVAVPTAAHAATEYVVVKGDSFYTIGKKNGVSVRAMQEANPGVDSSHLKIGQKLNVPSAAAHDTVVAAGAMEAAGTSPIHIVKSGETLLKIARQYGTSVKAIKSLNNLATDKIKVGQKLKVPVKEVTPAIAPAVEPAPAAAAVPVLPPPPGASLPPVSTAPPTH